MLFAYLEEAEGSKRSIESQLEEAKTSLARNGQWSDPNWWRRTSDALRFSKATCQRLQRMLSILKSVEKEKSSKRTERLFMNAAKLILNRDTFLSILDMAQNMEGGEQDGV